MVRCQQSHIADEENRVSEKADCTQPESTEADSIPSLLNHFVSPLWGWISILTFLWGPVIEVLEALTLKLCRIYSILLTDITLNNHIYLWPLFSHVTQTLCHSHPLSVINTNKANFIPVFEDLGLLFFSVRGCLLFIEEMHTFGKLSLLLLFFFFGSCEKAESQGSSFSVWAGLPFPALQTYPPTAPKTFIRRCDFSLKLHRLV